MVPLPEPFATVDIAVPFTVEKPSAGVVTADCDDSSIVPFPVTR